MTGTAKTLRIAFAAAIMLAATVVTGLYLGIQTRAQFREISQSWAVYAEDAEKKGVWISSIRGYLGYGGIIHTFKNYVIRGEDIYRVRMLDQLTQFNAVMNSYLAEPLPERERRVLETIRATVREYETKLEIAERATRANWPAERTDRLVRVDDTEAILALQNLETLWRENRRQSTERIIAAVNLGEGLIGAGFVAMLVLVLAALGLGFLMALLLRDMQGTLAQLSQELSTRRRLERSEQRLAEAVEQSPATIIITDTAGRIQYVNRRFETLSGWTRGEVVGQTPKLIQSGDTLPEDYARMREGLALGQSWRGVLRNLRKDGGSYWVETTILPLVDADGVVRNYLGIGEDISEKLVAREQLARAQKMEAVGLLAGGIAHDFNNILTTIIGAAHLAAMDVEPGSDPAAEIEQIDIAARRAQSLVRQLLTFARREPGLARPSDICAVIAEVTRLISAAIPPTIKVEGAEECSPVAVLADPTHLHQILMNLCSNAAESLGGRMRNTRTGTIRIGAEKLAAPPEGLADRPGGWVRILVADDGPGMSEETRRRVFDAFFTTKPMGKGTGLGLAVVQGLVQEMGGRIEVDSAPGAGARFSVFLPGTDAAVATDRAVAGDLPKGHERILLVDDETEIAATFRRLLTRLGYQVEAFTSPVIAREHFATNPGRYDLLISDVVMPALSGPELAAALRATRGNLPVIFCTGYAPSRIVLDGPAPVMLDKPVDPAQLAQRVRDVLDAAARSG